MKRESANALQCECGSQRTHVLWRRWRPRDGSILRRHECQDCKTRFASIEAVVSPLVAMTPRNKRATLSHRH